MGCIYVAKIDFAENLFKQILYIVLSSNVCYQRYRLAIYAFYA